VEGERTVGRGIRERNEMKDAGIFGGGGLLLLVYMTKTPRGGNKMQYRGALRMRKRRCAVPSASSGRGWARRRCEESMESAVGVVVGWKRR